MQAGWYLKSADAPVAHWWDGFRYTDSTTPLSGYPFPVHPDPLAAAPVAPPVVAPPVAAPAVAGPLAAGPPRTGMNRGLLWGLIGGGVLLVLIVIGIVVAVVLSSLARPAPDPILPPTTSAPSAAPDEPDEPTDAPTGTATDRQADEMTEGVFIDFVRSGVPSLAAESDESVLAAGYLVCEMFDEGQDFFTINEIIAQSGVAEDESIVFVAMAVGALCPEHTDSISG